MVGTTSTNGQDLSYIRKIRKPMVERKRRERMNQSISQLKSLISQTIKENTAPMTRVDKADILELAVFHLTQLQQQQQQQQQRSVTMATETAAFSAGYKACAREAVTYLTSNKMTSSTVTGSLSSHLHSSYLMHSKRQQPSTQLYEYSRGGYSKRQSHVQSTPLSFHNSFPELNLSGYSPILNSSQILPELTSSFVQAGLNSSFSSESSGTCSSVSFSSTESCQLFSNNSTENDCRTEEEDLESIDVVTIGKGKENEIGHVIKEVPWRPF